MSRYEALPPKALMPAIAAARALKSGAPSFMGPCATKTGMLGAL